MNKIAIYVATTQGPVQIERITIESAPQSVVCLQRSSTVLPISPDYDDFVRSGSGVIQREFGNVNATYSYRIDLSGKISGGKSWQLGFFIAHVVVDSDKLSLATPDEEADEIIWITGEVDYDLNVNEVKHLREKIYSTESSIKQWVASGIPVNLYIPIANKKDMPNSNIGTECNILFFENVAGVLNNLGVNGSSKHTQSNGNTSLGLGNIRTKLVHSKILRALLVVFLVGIWSFGFVGKEGAVDSKGTNSSVETPVVSEKDFNSGTPIKIYERRAPVGRNCAEVHFGKVDAILTAVEKNSEGKFIASHLSELCGLLVKVNLADPVKKWDLAFAPANKNILLSSESTGAVSEYNQQTWVFDLPRRMKYSVTYKLLLYIAQKGKANNVKSLLQNGKWKQALKKIDNSHAKYFIIQHELLKPD